MSNEASKIHCFTFAASCLLRRIVTPAAISLPTKDYQQPSQKDLVRALWDTGATGSVITPEQARRLGLIPASQKQVMGVHGPRLQNVYLVDIYLWPERIRIAAVEVTESGDHKHDFDIIIGMDVITLGDLAITSAEGKTALSFRIPSIEKIDFVAKSRKPRKPATSEKVGRNEPCPCGSGKKYKLCHGRVRR